MTGLMTAAVVMLGVLLVKVLFFAITLPFRIAFAVLFFPFWIAKTVLKLAVGVVMVPLLLLVGWCWPSLAALAAIAAIVAPLLPLLIVGLLVWAVFRSFSRPRVPGGETRLGTLGGCQSVCRARRHRPRVAASLRRTPGPSTAGRSADASTTTRTAR